MIVAQGPLRSPLLVQSLPLLQTYGKVIVSSWEGFDESILTTVRMSPWNVEAIINQIPYTEINEHNRFEPEDRITGTYNRQNIYNHIHGTILGLRRLDTEYAIRVRTDEYYPTLDPVYNALAPRKLVTGNIFARNAQDYRLHASDHTYGCNRNDMIHMLERAAWNCVHAFEEILSLDLTAEQVLCVAFAQVMTGIPSITEVLDRGEELMEEYFVITDMTTDIDFIYSFNSGKVLLTPWNINDVPLATPLLKSTEDALRPR